MRDEYLFVYGTLRSGIENPVSNQIYPDVELMGAACVQGELFDIGSYPGIILKTNGAQVTGELLKLKRPEKILSLLDGYEGFLDEHSEYVRQKTLVVLDDKQLDAWIYVYNRPVEGKLKIAGDYLNYLKKKQNEYGTSNNED